MNSPSTQTSSAPGKLVLLGEYAVLYGAPAIVSATAQRARVQVLRKLSGGWHIQCPGLYTDGLRFERAGDPHLTEKLPLLAAVLNRVTSPPANVQITLDTQEFACGGNKLGLGSSAALCTAALWALAEPQGRQLSTALSIHRAFQCGRGSGIDVAASVHGGTLVFKGGRAESLPTLTALKWPVQGLWVWSGQAASTTDRLQRLERFGGEQPRALDQHLAGLTDSCNSAVRAAESQQVEPLLSALEEFTARLTILSQEAQLDVWTDAHRAIQRKASDSDVFYKTSGAGGGDCGLALHPDRDRLAHLLKKLVDEGHQAGWLTGDQRGAEHLAPDD